MTAWALSVRKEAERLLQNREELSCKVNTKTREVYDIDQDFDEPKGKVDFDDFNEYVLNEGIDFPVVSEKFKSDNPLAFWYGDK